jgi:hypothetical protein
MKSSVLNRLALPNPFTSGLGFFLLCLFGVYSMSADAKTAPYRYHHLETTGLTQSIENNGHWVAIQFHPASNHQAVLSLLGLSNDVVDVAANHITVEGELESTVLMTPNCEGCATPEPYQWFRLTRWWIRVPFQKQEVKRPDVLPSDVSLCQKRHLTLDEFDFRERSFEEAAKMRRYVMMYRRALEHAQDK